MILPLILLIPPFFLLKTFATPSPNFQLSSQIPPLAVASSHYSFQFAGTTFTSSDLTDIAYSLQDAPDWLHVNSRSRTIEGSPTLGDVGEVAFQVVATDASGSASMQLTLVVTSDNRVESPDSIKDQLDRFGVLANGDSLTYRTTESFTITFQPDTFRGADNAVYFATSRDRTPLPSWIHFDPTTLTFSGASPPLIDIPQTFGVSLHASTVPGFASGVVSFDLIINDHQLAFVPFEITAISTAQSLDLKPIFRNNLLLDGQNIQEAMLTNTHVQLPAGMSYDTSTMLVSGTSAGDLSGNQIRIFANDAYGDTAQALIHVQTGPTLFRSQLGTIKAVMGRPFKYHLPDTLFADAVTAVSIDLGAASQWLKYEASSQAIQGKIPTDVSPTIIMATMTASSATNTATEEFGIRVVRSAKRSAHAPTTTTSIPTPHFADATAPPSSAASEVHKLAGLSAGKIAGIVIVVVLVVAILLAALFIYCRRRRKRRRDTDLKSRIVVQKLPDDSVDDLSEYGAGLSDQQKEFIDPLPLMSGTAGHPKRPDRFPEHARCLSRDSVLQPSQTPAWTSADGSRATAWNPKHGDGADRDWISRDSIANDSSTEARFRYSNVSGPGGGLHADLVSVGLGHGRPSVHSPSPEVTGDGRGLSRNRLNRMSTGKGPLSSRQLFSFGPDQRQRQRLGGIPPPSIRLVEPRDEVDFNEKYHNYIRKRASSKRKSNPLFAGYSTRISSHQSSFLKQSSSLRPRRRTRDRESRSPSVGADRSSDLLERVRTGSSPNRSDRSNDWEDVTETDYSGSNYGEQAKDGQELAFVDRSELDSEAGGQDKRRVTTMKARNSSDASFDATPAGPGTREASVASAPDSTRSRGTGKAFV